MNKLKEVYDEGWKNLIKPEKYLYETFYIDLHWIDGVKVEKTEMNIPHNNFNIYCNLYNTEQSDTLIIYCHSWGSNSLEGFDISKYFLPDYSFCVFDFLGSGLSERDYVTIGLDEGEQIYSVIKEAAKVTNFKKFILMGKSMGAVSILNYLSKYEKEFIILCVVLYSPFKTLKSSIIDTMKNLNNIPSFLTSLFFFPLKRKSLEITKLNILDNNPVNIVKNINVPAMFIVGLEDKITTPQNVNEVFFNYGKNTEINKSLKLLKDVEHHDGFDDNILPMITKFINTNHSNSEDQTFLIKNPIIIKNENNQINNKSSENLLNKDIKPSETPENNITPNNTTKDINIE